MDDLELVGRIDEVCWVHSALSNRERLFLIGPRRFGKTSILVTATERAESEGALVLYVNAEKFATTREIAAELIRQTAAKLRKPVAQVMQRLGDVFRALQPSINYDPVTDGWSVKLAAAVASGEVVLLADALDRIDELAASLPVSVAVVIDEFQQVVAAEGIVAERQIRSVVQTHRHVGYVFAGSATTLLMAMTSDHSRPFYRLGASLYLGPIPREDFRSYIKGAFAKTGIDAADAAVEQILDTAQDVPYTVQVLADRVWKTAQRDERSAIAASDVSEAVARLLDLYDPQYATLQAQLTPNQRKALVAAAHSEDGVNLTAAATAREHRLAVSALRRALDALVDKGILRKVRRGRERVRFVFEDPMFRVWVGEVFG